jgi:ABC-type multidrug transport system permease subunit
MTGQRTQRPDRTRLVVSALVAFVGLVWIAQGLGAPIGGGFMVGDLFWAYAGLVLVALAIGYAALPRLRRR